jgi:hypothetical protein
MQGHSLGRCEDEKARPTLPYFCRARAYTKLLLLSPQFSDFNDAKYPIEFGSYGALNEKGEKLVEIGLQNIIMRHLLDKSSDEAAWKTYRDVDPSPLRSIYTGQVPTPLPRPWLEMQTEDMLKSDS